MTRRFTIADLGDVPMPPHFISGMDPVITGPMIGGSDEYTPESEISGDSSRCLDAHDEGHDVELGLPLLAGKIADAVYVPQHYEPNYAYPLIVWLYGHPPSDFELHQLLAPISTRNYFGIGFDASPLLGSSTGRKSGARGTGQPFGTDGIVRNDSSPTHLFSEFASGELEPNRWVETRLCETILRARTTFHIHSERIYIAGIGRLGTVALQLGLKRPDWFGGTISLGGGLPEERHLLARYHDLRGKRVFLAGGVHDAETAPQLVRTQRILFAAGVNVLLSQYDARQEVTRPMLLDIDRWLMNGICEPALVA